MEEQQQQEQQENGGVPASEQAVGLSGSTLRSGPEDGTSPTIPHAEPKKRRSGLGAYTLLAASAMMGGMMGGGFPIIGGPGYRYPQPKNTDNSPDRAKGMKPFDIDGVTIYAGTLKAARKKARLLSFDPTT